MYGFADAMNDYSATTPQKAPPGVFVATSVLLFFATVSAADSIGFVPYYVDGTAPRETGERVVSSSDGLALSDLPQLGELVQPAPAVLAGVAPTRIVAASIGLDLNIQNPATRDIGTLDEILKDGPARYVDSALLGEKGNVLIFAHSSRLPVVRNQMYKAFNRVAELKPGETITLSGGGREFLYTVKSVRRADAEEELISLAKDGNKLTLATCDTLTSKTSRFIVEAELVGEI